MVGETSWLVYPLDGVYFFFFFPSLPKRSEIRQGIISILLFVTRFDK